MAKRGRRQTLQPDSTELPSVEVGWPQDIRRTFLRVCLWYWGRRGGGLRLTRELVEALSAQHRLSLSLSSYCEEAPQTGGQLSVHTVRTYRDSREFTLSMARLPGALKSFRNFLQSTQPELILVPMLAPWQALLLPFLGAWRQKTVVLIHDPEPHPGAETAAIDWLSVRIAVRYAGRIVTLTENSAERIRRIAPSWRSIDVVPMGIPAADAANCVARPYPRARPFRFLFFGRLEEYKGLDILIGAVRLLDNAEDWEIEVIGGGPEAEHVRRTLGSHPRARLRLEWVPEREVDGIVSAADCLICPYTEASQSGVVVQAIGAAVPSIVTPVGALPEQVEFGRLGLVTEAVSALALSKAMKAIMGDPARYEALSEATAEAARERYAWPRLIDRLVSE